MKRALLVVLGVVAFAFASPASASMFQTRVSANGTLEVTPPFQSWDNNRVGDCQYASGADLVLAEWPHAKITTAQVLAAYRQYGIQWQATGPVNPDGTTPTPGLYAGMLYLIHHGFGGHRAASVTEIAGFDPHAPINRGVIMAAADHGGVYVVWWGPTQGHVFAMVHATATHVTLVDDGYVYNDTWGQFLYDYHYGGANLIYYAVRWAE